MASASTFQSVLRQVLGSPLTIPSIFGGIAFVAYKNQDALISFVTGPGSLTRILLLLSAVINWKALPLGWSYRVITTYWIQLIKGGHVKLGPKALFQPVVTTSRAPPLEIDYNMHKSNSTFFGDADVARAHCICYLVRPGWDACNDNARTRIVLDPKTGQPMKGTCSIVLGAVQCSFKREIAMFQKYELWTSILSWDRKWIYTVTYFVKAGTVRPKTWLHPASKSLKTRGTKDQPADWEKKVLATSCSKYVFKLGRFTVHPAIMLEASGLLPERPGGWTGGETQMGDDSADLSNVDLSQDGEWDWRRIEASRRKGYEFASQLDGLDEVKHMFDGGEHGAIASWGPG